MNRVELNARRLLCPLPVIRTQAMIKTLARGDVLEVICTDPGAMQDIPAWVRVHGHRIVEMRQENNEYIVVIEVAG